MPPESIFNSDVSMRLLLELSKIVPLHLLRYKEIMLEVSGRRAKVRIPDLLILGEECRAALESTNRGTITHEMPPPLIAIEVVSPGTENESLLNMQLGELRNIGLLILYRKKLLFYV